MDSKFRCVAGCNKLGCSCCCALPSARSLFLLRHRHRTTINAPTRPPCSGKYLEVIPTGISHLIFKKSKDHYTWKKVRSRPRCPARRELHWAARIGDELGNRSWTKRRHKHTTFEKDIAHAELA